MQLHVDDESYMHRALRISESIPKFVGNFWEFWEPHFPQNRQEIERRHDIEFLSSRSSIEPGSGSHLNRGLQAHSRGIPSSGAESPSAFWSTQVILPTPKNDKGQTNWRQRWHLPARIAIICNQIFHMKPVLKWKFYPCTIFYRGFERIGYGNMFLLKEACKSSGQT